MNKPTSQWSDLDSRLRAFMEAHGRLGAFSGPTSAAAPFNELALAVFRRQFEHVPAYQRLCLHRGLRPEMVTRWQDIPAVPAAAFKELDITSLAPAERTRVFHSSGTTTQKRSRHFHDAATLALYDASALSWFARHLLGDGQAEAGDRTGPRPPREPGARLRFLSLTPPGAEAPHSSLVHMIGTVSCRWGAPESGFIGKTEAGGAWTINGAAFRSAAGKACDDRQPLVLLGTAFNFVQLLDALERCGETCPLPTGSRIMETGGYKGRTREIPKADLHAALVERLGILPSHVVCEYGMSELSSQAYDRVIVDLPGANGRDPQAGGPAGAIPPRVFRFPPWARVRILSPETGREVADGETGLIRVFDLANLRSVMALQTEDLGVRRGDGFELLGRTGAAEPRGCSLMSGEESR